MSADGFKDQVVLVTGGSRGIGRAAAALFGQAGATVAITYKSRKPEADHGSLSAPRSSPPKTWG